MSVINRFLSDVNLDRVRNDLKFLIRYLDHPKLRGEIALEIRSPNVLTLYDRGNRLAKIEVQSSGNYRIALHQKFACGTPLSDSNTFPVKSIKGQYADYIVTAAQIHSFLQLKHLKALRSRIKKVNYKEELHVAQMIASDTNRLGSLLVIDREIGHRSKGHRPVGNGGRFLDLLALQKKNNGRYRFLAIEVKLGNSPELDEATCYRQQKRSAVKQINEYVSGIESHIADYITCYRNNVEQKIALGIIGGWSQAPDIVPEVKGMLAIAGYTGIAAPYVRDIRRDHPQLLIQQIDYRLRVKGPQ